MPDPECNSKKEKSAKNAIPANLFSIVSNIKETITTIAKMK